MSKWTKRREGEEESEGRNKQGNMVSVKMCVCTSMYVCIFWKRALGRGFVCPPQVLRGFRFKQSGESHYLSAALLVYTRAIPKRLQRFFIPVPLSVSVSDSLSVRKREIAITNWSAKPQRRLQDQMALFPNTGLLQVGCFGGITLVKCDHQWQHLRGRVGMQNKVVEEGIIPVLTTLDHDHF